MIYYEQGLTLRKTKRSSNILTHSPKKPAASKPSKPNRIGGRHLCLFYLKCGVILTPQGRTFPVAIAPPQGTTFFRYNLTTLQTSTLHKAFNGEE